MVGASLAPRVSNSAARAELGSSGVLVLLDLATMGTSSRLGRWPRAAGKGGEGASQSSKSLRWMDEILFGHHEVGQHA